MNKLLRVTSRLRFPMKFRGWRVALAILTTSLAATNTWAAPGEGENVLIQFGAPTVNGQPNPTYGGFPYSGLIRDSAGNLYGTTSEGGEYGYGTVFELSPTATSAWKKKVLYSFCSQANCTDGANPYGGLFLYNGNLYGTTVYGGNNACLISASGCGVVFELTPPAKPKGSWTYTVVHTFSYADGAWPAAALISDAEGNLYGTATVGGMGTCQGQCVDGVVFELTPPATPTGSWTYNLLHTFNAAALDGGNPYAPLIFDSQGNLYGTTVNGGLWGYGTVFEMTPIASGGWNVEVIHSFPLSTSPTPAPDGNWPLGGLVMDGQGNLYGTTLAGGDGVNSGLTECIITPNDGCGTVYELSLENGNWTETVLYNFGAAAGDGWSPYSTLIIDASGNLYGTNNFGGEYVQGGTLFSLTPPATVNGNWTETVLYDFGSSKDGAAPYPGVISDPTGNLYGATVAGGTGACDTSLWGYGDYLGCGTVFEITSSLTPKTTSFGTQLDFTPSAPFTIYLHNATAAPLTGISASFTGTNAADFSITGGTCSSSLVQSASCTYLVVFTPSEVGAETATLEVIDSDGTETATLKGLGTEVSLSPSTMAFGTVTIPTTLNETITNVGTTLLTFTEAPLIVGGASADFTVVPWDGTNSTCLSGAAIQQSGTCTITVTFTPPAGAVKSFKSTLYIFDNGAGTGSSQKVAMSGKN